MKLYAISDLHLGHIPNREALSQLAAQPEDWLILAGDVGENPVRLEWALALLTRRFQQVIWVPGNHDLWTLPGQDGPRGVALYEHLVGICRRFGVLTPEDPYVVWPGAGPACTLAPLFTLYDYSFRPDDVPHAHAIDWAAESGILCADENYLHPDPFPSREAWCDARLEVTAARLNAIPSEHPPVLISHFPLRRDLVRIPRVPRFTIWCGTRRTEDWHRRFRARVVVSGHLHVRATDYRDGVRFEEVSLGYPHQWKAERGISFYLREILPGPCEPHA